MNSFQKLKTILNSVSGKKTNNKKTKKKKFPKKNSV